MTALLFPGQGTQRVGMGQALRMACPDAAAPVLDQACSLDGELASLMRRGPQSRLAATEHAQLAVTAANLAALAVLRAAPEPFSAVSGHSVGFLAALAAARALEPGAALRLAKLRGELMGALPAGGAMAAISGLPAGQVQQLAAQSAGQTSATVVVGLVNGPTASVVSGDEPAVSHACTLAAGRGARASRLRVSHAFHSPLMAGIRGPWRDIVASAQLRPPAVPLIADLTGEIVERPERIGELLVEQLTSPVRWDLVAGTLAASGETDAIEAGDSTVLRSFARAYPAVQVTSMAQPHILARYRRRPAAGLPATVLSGGAEGRDG